MVLVTNWEIINVSQLSFERLVHNLDWLRSLAYLREVRVKAKLFYVHVCEAIEAHTIPK